MQRFRRWRVQEHKQKLAAFEEIQDITDQVELQLRYRQLKADLKLMNIERLLSQKIEWLQQRHLDRLKEI